MKKRFYSALVILAVILGTSSARALDLPLPLNLPALGSRSQLMDYAATNTGLSVPVFIAYTNTTNVFVSFYVIPGTDSLHFSSYTDFRSFVAQMGLYTIDLLHNDMKPGTDVTLYVDAYSTAMGGFHGIEISNVNLGPVTGITSNMLANIDPTYLWAIIPVPGLTVFAVSNSCTPPYFFRWDTSGKLTVNNGVKRPGEATQSGLLVLNEWYCVASNKMRMVLSTRSQTAVYTQNGDQLVGKQLAICRDKITVNMPRGSETTLFSSTDMKNWAVVTNYTFPFALGQAVVPINTSSSKRFYRSFSY